MDSDVVNVMQSVSQLLLTTVKVYFSLTFHVAQGLTWALLLIFIMLAPRGKEYNLSCISAFLWQRKWPLNLVLTLLWPKLFMSPSLPPIKWEVHNMSHRDRSGREGRGANIFTRMWHIPTCLSVCEIASICMWVGMGQEMGIINLIVPPNYHQDHLNSTFASQKASYLPRYNLNI